MKKYTSNVRYEKYLDLLVLTVTSALFIASYSTFRDRNIYIAVYISKSPMVSDGY